MKDILKDFFIHNSTLGMLKGEGQYGNEASVKWSGKDFTELSFLRKTFGFMFVSTVRFIIDFLTLLLPAVILASLVKTIIFVVEVDDYKTIEILEPYNHIFGDYLSFWGMFFISLFTLSIFFAVVYIIIRSIVNVFSFIYYAFKK